MTNPWIFDLVEERVLVEVCLHGMLKEFRIFLENLSFSSFSKLVKAAHHNKESSARSLSI